MSQTEFADRQPDEIEDRPSNGIMLGVFDKRILLPLSNLPNHIANETDEPCDPDRIDGMISAGWFEILSSEMTGVDAGYPLYVPSRLALFLKLERQGVSSAELAAFATTEEQLIDEILVNDEMPYEHDDDIAIMLCGCRDELREARMYHEWYCAAAAGNAPAWLTLTDDLATPAGLQAKINELSTQIERIERYMNNLNRYRERGIDTLRSETQEDIRRTASQIRWVHETVRISSVQRERAQLATGYSHFIFFRSHRETGVGLESFTFSNIDWHATVRSPWLAETDAEPALPIRLPGVVIRGETLLLTRRTTASEYKRLSDEYDLDGYFRALAERQGERLCARCLAALAPGASAKRMYCTETCRNAAKAEAYRCRHPGWRKADRHGLPRDLFEPPDGR